MEEKPLKELFRLKDGHSKALKKIGLETVRDLLYYFPRKYGGTDEFKNINELRKGDEVVIAGKISGLKTKKAFRKKIPMAEADIEDATGSIKIVWFHQPYLAKMINEGVFVKAQGKVSERKGELYLSNPKIENIPSVPTGAGISLFSQSKTEQTIYPVYPETRGLTSNWIYHSVQKIFRLGTLNGIKDPIPQEILKKYNLPDLKTALIWIHSPKKENHAISARKRFAFEEIFLIQLEKAIAKDKWKKHKGFKIIKDEKEILEFAKRFPFPLTQAQKKSINHILEDFKKGEPMSRLLEGDVGSGKTAVAAMASYAVVSTRPGEADFGNLQTAYMAPTEILAQQHFESFIKYFNPLNGPQIQVGLITGSGCKKFPSKVSPDGATEISRTQLLKWVANGEIPILIGTHALIQKTVKFKHLALVIIDEQHRFGTEQRRKLREKEGLLPHLLSMTATPIPRTLSLTVYGDLDLSLLDEMPAGRKMPETHIVLPNERSGIYEKIRQELRSGRQVFVICPRIDEPDPSKEMALQAKSVKEEAKRLKKEIFPEYEIGILHSKMKPKEKERVMSGFKDGIYKILVSTSVVEVGVNVLNASVILIEGAERFGLAQLHQLRGRVMRSSHQPYCFIFSESKSGKSIDRLKALKTAKNGFELAEFDLIQRGAGELYGRKQWGITDLGMEAIKNIKMVEIAREEAKKLVSEDPEINKFPELKKRLSNKNAKIHLE